MERKGYLALIKAWCKTSVDRTVRHPLSAFLWKALTKVNFFGTQGRSKNSASPFVRPDTGLGLGLSLLRRWLGTKGRSKDSVAPFVRPDTGLGLVETLVAAGVGAVLAYGVLRVSLVAVQTAQVASTEQAEKDLQITIERVLGHEHDHDNDPDTDPIPADCRWNLDPDRLSDTANKKGRLVDGTNPRGWTKTQGDNAGSSPDTSNDTIVLDIGDFKNGLIDIKSLELLKGGANTTWTFIVFYTKPQAGVYETLGGGECDWTTTTPKKAGCYWTTCDLDIDHDSSDNVTTCAISEKGCSGVKLTFNADCDEGEYLKGLTADGQKICELLPSCADGTVWTGKFWKAGDSDKPDGVAVGDPKCARLVKFSAPPGGGNKVVSCPSGQVLRGFSAAGEPVCVVPALSPNPT